MQLYGPKELAASLRTVRENTIKIAEDIPEERYGYRPTPESRSVEQLALSGFATAAISAGIDTRPTPTGHQHRAWMTDSDAQVVQASSEV